MDDYNIDRFHNRKNPRMKWYDYSQPNYYFITVCTHEKRCIFGHPGALNRFGQIAEQGILAIGTHFPNVTVDKYVVMPNHIHIILILQEGSTNLSVVVGQYKAFVTRQVHKIDPKCNVWQASFHDHVIRDQNGYERIWNYIHANPQRWQDDCFYSETVPFNQEI